MKDEEATSKPVAPANEEFRKKAQDIIMKFLEAREQSGLRRSSNSRITFRCGESPHSQPIGIYLGLVRDTPESQTKQIDLENE